MNKLINVLMVSLFAFAMFASAPLFVTGANGSGLNVASGAGDYRQGETPDSGATVILSALQGADQSWQFDNAAANCVGADCGKITVSDPEPLYIDGGL